MMNIRHGVDTTNEKRDNYLINYLKDRDYSGFKVTDIHFKGQWIFVFIELSYQKSFIYNRLFRLLWRKFFKSKEKMVMLRACATIGTLIIKYLGYSRGIHINPPQSILQYIETPEGLDYRRGITNEFFHKLPPIRYGETFIARLNNL
jgi:hypothetical protein